MKFFMSNDSYGITLEGLFYCLPNSPVLVSVHVAGKISQH